MNLPPESGQAGRSSTSSMNGREWPDRSDLPAFHPMQKTSGYGIGNPADREWRISAGYRGSLEGGFSAWASNGVLRRGEGLLWLRPERRLGVVTPARTMKATLARTLKLRQATCKGSSVRVRFV
jgi:hypothetical protein